jgi:hypothetical protein
MIAVCGLKEEQGFARRGFRERFRIGNWRQQVDDIIEIEFVKNLRVQLFAARSADLICRSPALIFALFSHRLPKKGGIALGQVNHSEVQQRRPQYLERLVASREASH